MSDLYRGAAVGQFGNFVYYRRNLTGYNQVLYDWFNSSNMILYPGTLVQSMFFEVPQADGSISLMNFVKAKVAKYGYVTTPAQYFPIWIPISNAAISFINPFTLQSADATVRIL